MSDKRLVHDILAEHGSTPDGGQMQRRPVSFIQHGNKEDGFTYEGICPWCGETLCYVPHAQTKVVGGLYRILLHQQKIHWQSCTANTIAGPREMAVEVTTKPLNVEKPFTVN